VVLKTNVQSFGGRSICGAGVLSMSAFQKSRKAQSHSRVADYFGGVSSGSYDRVFNQLLFAKRVS
jgi:putative IMPACT (imprinted ancient) family translation regulator